MNIRIALACTGALVVAALRGLDEFLCLQRSRMVRRLR
jgi:hypothetical protein